VRTIENSGGSRVLFGMVVWLLVWGCTGQNDSTAIGINADESISQDPAKQPVIQFDTLSHDFGTILEGERVVCYFDYENHGEGSLVIQSVEASCGCTTPDWSREPLAPGEKESMQIVFDATGRSGAQLKLVTVISNASNPRVQLTLRADVKENV
jgi:hypothetical protein